MAETQDTEDDMSVDDQLTLARQAYKEISENLLRLSQQVDNLSNHYSQFIQVVDNQFLELSMRNAVIEYFLTKDEFSEYREKFINGEMQLEDLREIAENHVIPDMKKQREEVRQQQQQQENSDDDQPRIIIPEDE